MKYENIRVSNIQCKNNEYFTSEEICNIMTKYIDKEIKKYIESIGYNPDEIIKIIYTQNNDDILVEGLIGDEEIESWIQYEAIYELSLKPEIRNKKLSHLNIKER